MMHGKTMRMRRGSDWIREKRRQRCELETVGGRRLIKLAVTF